MITCDFRGELGNNLFQLAMLIGYADKHGLPFCIPPHRDRPKPLEIEETFEYPYLYGELYVPGYRCSDMYAPEYERVFGYQDLPKMDRIKLSGYFQSEKYFKNVEDKLRNVYLKFCKRHEDYINEKYGSILTGNTVALHIRNFGNSGYRSDIENFHPVVPLEFSKKVVESLPSDMTYIVISHDIPWCREHIDFIKNPIYAEGGNISTDLLLLSRCKSVVIANSTYSWWGAWLNPHKDKKIYVPKTYWFGPALKHLNMSDLFPPEWILL